MRGGEYSLKKQNQSSQDTEKKNPNPKPNKPGKSNEVNNMLRSHTESGGKDTPRNNM